MSLLGPLWGACLVLAWRTGRWFAYLFFVILMSASTAMLEALFSLKSQVQDVQGLTMAFGGVGIFFAVGRDAILRVARLEEPSTREG
jgi:hypothetical protein